MFENPIAFTYSLWKRTMPDNQDRTIHVCAEHPDGPCEEATVASAVSSLPPNALVCTPESDSWIMKLGEPIKNYCPGGYHPVNLRDTFQDGRYRVCHKLGWGNSSTVWLARDGLFRSWVALKILTARDTISSKELSTLQALHHTGASPYLPGLVDHFKFEGPNGVHQCLVLELLGPEFNEVVILSSDTGERMHWEDFLRVCRQLLQCLSEVHDAGYAHGDIDHPHVVFAATRLASLPEEELLETIGPPKTAELSLASGAPLCSGLPKHIVDHVRWEDWVDEDEDIRVIGWSKAWMHGAEPSSLDQEHDMAVPETFFMNKFDYKVDLWRAGYLIYQWLFVSTHFNTLTRNTCSYIATMIGFVEDLPEQWQATWQAIQWEHGWFPYVIRGDSWMVRCWNMWTLEPELKPLLNVIMGLVRFLPSQRVSATEAIELVRGREQYPLVTRDCVETWQSENINN